MRAFMLATLAGLVVLAPAGAEGLLYRLPADGASVRYEMDFSMNTGGMEKTGKGKLSLSSVGEKDVGGKPARWIEIKLQLMIDDKEQIHIAKALIPVERLKAGESPLDHVAKGWHKEGDREPKEMTDFKGREGGPVPVFLAGPLKDAKKLPKAIIDSKLGKLECEGHTGTTTIEPGDEKVEVKYENRLHEKAPFGVVSSKMTFKMSRNGEERGNGVMTFRLVEVGKGTKSELPDHQ